MARPTSRTRERRSDAQPEPQAGPFDALRSHWKGILATLVVVGGLVALVVFDPPPPGVEFPSLGNEHIASVSEPHIPYNSSPPSSGPHVGTLFPWGEVSTEPVPPELFAHNLEDGGIVLTYDCPDGCPDFVDGLGQLAEGRVIVTPYRGIADPDGTPHRGAAVAWTRVFYFDELTDATVSEIETFISLYEGIDHHVR